MDMNVSLSDDLKRFLDQRIASGQYATASDVVRDALRLLQQRDENEKKLEWLRDACGEGTKSGDAGELDFLEVKA